MKYVEYTNAAMTDMLGMTVESSQVLDVFHAQEEVMRDKKLPLSLLSTLTGGYKQSPQPWRFDFLPRFDEKNVYERCTLRVSVAALLLRGF